MAQSKSEMLVEISAELLHQGHRVRFRPAGKSMYPTIKDGEAVTVKPISPIDVRSGDIVLYKADRRLIAHRVVAIRRDKNSLARFILRGDASETCDEPVAAGEILGKVISVERKGRSIDLGSFRAKLLRVARLYVSRARARIY